jgi:two-component system, cell cycle response regulator
LTILQNSIDILDNVFVIKRIIDPKHKKIIDFDNDIKINNDNNCFDLWEKKTPCSNCISMKALKENASFSKLEALNDKLYMIIAAPIDLNGDKYVVELIKEVTDDPIFTIYNNKTAQELKDEINELNTLIVTDELTNLYNRRYLDRRLPSDLKNLSSSDFSLSLVMLDIDKFKSINDNYGHLCGDYVIKEVANLLNTYIKNFNGWTCRYGGDEFIAVIENISNEKTYEIVNKLKELVKNTYFIYNDTKINVTCSFGVYYLNHTNIGLNDALSKVDEKLYQAKKTRNTVS